MKKYENINRSFNICNTNNDNTLNYSDEDKIKLNDEYYIYINKKIGEGSFGKIYNCNNINDNKLYACKLESLKEKCGQLINEYKILSILKKKSIYIYNI